MRGSFFLTVFLMLAAACQKDGPAQCGCPAGGALAATIELGCPAVSTTVLPGGACSIMDQGNPSDILVSAGDDGGQCQVEITFENGGTSTVGFQVTPEWLPCGSDPHGCGQAIVITPMFVQVGACRDGGVDGAVSD
jgi:hypothetical protein